MKILDAALDLARDWWRVDPAGVVFAVGAASATLLGAATVALAVKA